MVSKTARPGVQSLKRMQDDFIKMIETIARREGRRNYEVYDKWLEAAFRAIVGKTVMGKLFEENEAAYMKIVAWCREPKQTMGDFAQMLGLCIHSLNTETMDFLSPIFMEVASNSDLGQFFTPWELCRLMAKMTAPDAVTLLESARKQGRDYITIQEPAVGAGGMVLAMTLEFTEQGLDHSKHVHWTAIDVDLTAVRSTYVQCAAANISATVIHGNTLSLEQWGAYQTPAAIMYPKIDHSAKLFKEILTPEGETIVVRARERPKMAVA